MKPVTQVIGIAAAVSFMMSGAIAQPVVNGPNLQSATPLVKSAHSDGDRLAVRSSFFDEAAEAVSFGELPAIPLSEAMRYMNPNNAVSIVLTNTSQNSLVIGGVRFVEVEAEEAQSPFDACAPAGTEWPAIKLEPGQSTLDIVCYFPTVVAPAQAIVQYLDPAGAVLASFPLKGSGRELVKDETLPMGVMEVPDGHFSTSGITGPEITEFGVFIGDKEQDIPIAFQAKDGNCTASIFGGAHAPNPAVGLRGRRAINTNPGKPDLDDGTVARPINVGQRTFLGAKVDCDPVPHGFVTAVKWTIGGMAVKDYDESIGSGNVRLIPHTAADLAARSLTLYWQRPGTHTITADVTYTRLGVTRTVKVTRKFVVEINGKDVDRQMEDFYTWNHSARILTQHAGWHFANGTGRCHSQGKQDFFDFHRKFIGSANAWRAAFGPYPQIVSWDPAQPVPNLKVDEKHAARRNLNPRIPMPSYFSRAGGKMVSACSAGVTKLKQFPSAAALAHQMEPATHNQVHRAVGGDMGTYASPKDPVFYRWHKRIDDVYADYLKP